MGINSGSINKGGSTITELTVVNGATIDSTTLVIDDTNNLVKIGDDLSLISDSSVIKMGDGNDVTLTHDGTTGVTIAATPITVDSGGTLTLDGASGVNVVGNAGEVDITTSGAVDVNSGAFTLDASTVSIDSSDNINITAGGSGKTLDIDASGALTIDSATSIGIGTNADKPITIESTTLDINASGLVTIDSNGGPISIGGDNNDQAINIGTQGTRTITIGVDQDGLDSSIVKINAEDVKIQNCKTTDGTFPKLTLQTGDQAIAANNILGQIDFQAPDDTGTDSDIVAASIVAIAEGAFSDTSNATSLQLRTGASEVATTKVTINSAGKVGIGDTDPGTALQVSGADAYLTLKNTTAENSDGGAETKIIFEDHANAALGQIETSHSGSADDTKGKMIFSTHTGSSLTAALTIDDTQKASFAGNVDITGGLSFDAGTAVTSIDTDLSSVSGSDDTLASAKAIKAYVDSSGGSGASALNGLSDVSFSSGDLLITSLDLLTTSDSAHNAAGTNVVIRGGNTTAGTSNNQAGGSLTFQGGQGKGTGEGGKIIFQTAQDAGGDASTLNALATRMTITQKGELLFGASQDAEIGVESTATDVAGKSLEISGGASTDGTDPDIAGGDITLIGGASKGNATPGEIKFQVIPAGGSGSSLNTTKQTQMTISQTGVLINDAGNASCDFRVEGEDFPNLLNVDVSLNQVGVGHDEGDPGTPGGTLYVRNKNDNSGGNVPLVLLDNDNDDVIALDIDAANTGTAVLTINADMLQTTNTASAPAAFFMSVDALTTGTAFEIASSSLNTSSRTLMKVQNTDGRADNVTMLHLNNGAHDNAAPFVLLEYSGNQTDHPMILEFRRSDTNAEADDMELGQINFVGVDDGGNLTTYGQIHTEAQDVTDGSEDGKIEFKTQINGTLTTQLQIDKGGVSFPTGLPSEVTVTTDNITLDASNNGGVILIMELGAAKTYTLPAPTDNYRVKFVAAQNNLTYNITVKTASASDRIIGLFARIDHAAESAHGYHTNSFSGANSTTISGSGDGSTGQNNQFVISDVVQGSVFEMFSDGTRWYVWGHLVSSQADVSVDVAATFSKYS